MITFIIQTVRLGKAITIGIHKDQEFRILIFMLLFLLAGSTIFYSRIEGWKVLDSLYFSVMTMSTIGYGDLVPTTPYAKIFTIVFAFLSVGVFVSINAKIVLVLIERKKAAALKKERSDTRH